MPDHGSSIVCACIDLTYDQAEAVLAFAPGQSFDDFLGTTGAGRDCTACMLDLEHFFVEAPRIETATEFTQDRPRRKSLSLKRRIYRLLDRLPPMMPINRSNWMPVLHGAGVEAYLWMANHSLLFDGGSDTTDYDVRFTVRDSSGKVFYKGRERLAKGNMLRHNLSSYFGKTTDLSVGSIQLDRFALRSKARGTTRPQIEILTPRAATSLHFQAATPGYDRMFAISYRPEEERVFLTVLNCDKTPFSLMIDYLAGGDEQIDDGVRITLKPFETRLVEIAISDAAYKKLAGRLLLMHLRSKGLGKLHLLCAENDISRLSIDHL